ncbi:hypothetical protein Pelo_15918 [Pelomyxa schiedti]|nr:hypothetical protein Pelo_15911 [Pelomyxa schiedti]KAH3742693.1 hypothetical protein Pelo_15918 [Pelomyxa schiedti]
MTSTTATTSTCYRYVRGGYVCEGDGEGEAEGTGKYTSTDYVGALLAACLGVGQCRRVCLFAVVDMGGMGMGMGMGGTRVTVAADSLTRPTTTMAGGPTYCAATGGRKSGRGSGDDDVRDYGGEDAVTEVVRRPTGGSNAYSNIHNIHISIEERHQGAAAFPSAPSLPSLLVTKNDKDLTVLLTNSENMKAEYEKNLELQLQQKHQQQVQLQQQEIDTLKQNVVQLNTTLSSTTAAHSTALAEVDILRARVNACGDELLLERQTRLELQKQVDALRSQLAAIHHHRPETGAIFPNKSASTLKPNIQSPPPGRSPPPHMSHSTTFPATTPNTRQVFKKAAIAAQLIAHPKTVAPPHDSQSEMNIWIQWIASLLSVQLAPENFYDSFKDGIMFLRILEKTHPGLVDWKRAGGAPTGKRQINIYQNMINCQYAFECLKNANLNVTGLDSGDIAIGNHETISQLVSQLHTHKP